MNCLNLDYNSGLYPMRIENKTIDRSSTPSVATQSYPFCGSTANVDI